MAEKKSEEEKDDDDDVTVGVLIWQVMNEVRWGYFVQLNNFRPI